MGNAGRDSDDLARVISFNLAGFRMGRVRFVPNDLKPGVSRRFLDRAHVLVHLHARSDSLPSDRFRNGTFN